MVCYSPMAFPTSNPNAKAISFNLRSHFTPTQFQSPSSSLSSSFHPHYAKTMQYMLGNAQLSPSSPSTRNRFGNISIGKNWTDCVKIIQGTVKQDDWNFETNNKINSKFEIETIKSTTNGSHLKNYFLIH